MNTPGGTAIDIVKCNAVATTGPEFLAALAAASADARNDVDALILQTRSNQWAADQLELRHAHLLLRDAQAELAQRNQAEAT